MRKSARHPARGFTLVELLVVLGVVALLVSILMPSLSAARAQARRTVCSSNLRELANANSYYSDDGGVYVPGAADFTTNLKRWHGERDGVGDVFDSSRGLLADYLGPMGEVKQCPVFDSDALARASGGFERGNGGYGYNNRFVGTQLAKLSGGEYVVTNDRAGAYVSDVKRPGATVMFTDSAFAQGSTGRLRRAGSGGGRTWLIEYSFAEPRFHPQYPTSRATPSIHFRHRERANVVWCDGHVEAERMTFSHRGRFYTADPAEYSIGWFGNADDNSLFDLE